MALAVSISADAGQEAVVGGVTGAFAFARASPASRVGPAGIISAIRDLAIDFGGLAGEAGKLLRHASLSIGDGEDFRRLPDEIEPRAVLKHNARLVSFD